MFPMHVAEADFRNVRFLFSLYTRVLKNVGLTFG